MPFEITPSAERFIRRMLRFSTTAESAFRLRVRPGGCSGLASEFDIEDAAPDSDELIVVSGVRMLVDFHSLGLLSGATVDFSDSIAQSGFVFRLPGKQQACCGSSAPQLVTFGSAGRQLSGWR
jgi:iron-sulfur cluster assembly protein